jgi:LAO/AO transport system kinase
LRKRPQDPQNYPKAVMVSALHENGIRAAWDDMQDLVTWRQDQGFFTASRAAQARYWFEQDVRAALLAQLDHPEAQALMAELGAAVVENALDPAVAAARMQEHLNG